MFVGINMSVTSSENGRLTHALGSAYLDAIRETGAVPLLIPAGANDAELRALTALADAFIFSGGPDYPPEFYGAEPHPETRTLHPVRAETDRRFARIVLRETHRPVLGICGGLQLAVIALGGRLIQHVARPEGHRAVGDTSARHAIRVRPGSRLRALLGADTVEVNSYHHQAADPDAVPPELRIAATAEDGTLEALEGVAEDRFLVLVQWHPECMDSADHRARIIGGFAAAAREHVGRR